MAPFEALYRMRFKFQVGWYEVGEFALLRPDFFYESLEKEIGLRHRKVDKNLIPTIKKIEFQVAD